MSVLDKHHEYKGLGILLDAMVKVKTEDLRRGCW